MNFIAVASNLNVIVHKPIFHLRCTSKCKIHLVSSQGLKDTEIKKIGKKHKIMKPIQISCVILCEFLCVHICVGTALLVLHFWIAG